MPYRPDKPCPEPGCGALVNQGRCPRHRRAPQFRQTARPERDDYYGSASWKQLREQALKLYGRQCSRCLSTVGLHVDHVTPRAEGGADEISNLVVLCHSHHSSKTLADRNRARARGKG
jgi:5-methylcytosine-specific restriction enzyme A